MKPRFRKASANDELVILVNPGHDLDELKETVQGLTSSSPNCAEFMSKFRSKDIKDNVTEIRVKWGSRDKQLFPRETLLTEENSEAVLRMMAIGGGQDVFDIKLEQKNQADEGAKKK